MSNDFVSIVRRNLQELRNQAKMNVADVEARLGLGPGWISGIEEGAVAPTIDIIAAILATYGKSLQDLVVNLPPNDSSHIMRDFYAIEDGHDLVVHFRYAKYDSTFRIQGASIVQFDSVLQIMRTGLARLRVGANDIKSKTIQTETVAITFLEAVRVWPNANPSDLWWFFVYRAYCDRFNHPVEHVRLDLQQSWKRTGGWALEEVLVRHYCQALAKNEIQIFIAPKEEKQRIFGVLQFNDRIESDKVDVLLTAVHNGKRHFFGVVHVKASFAERRTDDVPLSRTLIEAGYFSPLWTMDCKSTPSVTPVNRGELGVTWDGSENDIRSAKRKDIEDDGYFSACFSYNKNTNATPQKYCALRRVYNCDFSNPDDEFLKMVIEHWESFRQKNL